MKTVSTKLPDDEAENFKKIVLAQKLKGEDISQSGVVRELVREWIAENRGILDDLDDLD